MPTFVVECYWPGITEEHVKHALALVERVRNGAATGDSVDRLGCILIPTDGMAIFLFRAPSALRLAETAQQSGLPFDRIIESIPVGFSGTHGELLEGDPHPGSK